MVYTKLFQRWRVKYNAYELVMHWSYSLLYMYIAKLTLQTAGVAYIRVFIFLLAH